MFLTLIAEVLKKKALDVTVEFPGCVVIEVNEETQLWFGTANETWDATVYTKTSEGEFDATDECINTHVIVEDTDAAFIAGAIYTATQNYLESINTH